MNGSCLASLTAFFLAVAPIAKAGEIHEAIYANDYAKVQELLQHNPESVEEVDTTGKTPLLAALDGARPDIARILISHNASVNVQDDDGATPLHGAAHGKDANLVRLLLERGASINVADRLGNTPLHWCINSLENRGEMIDLLASFGADLNVTNHAGKTPLIKAVVNVYEEATSALVQNGAVMDAFSLAAIGSVDELEIKFGSEPGLRLSRFEGMTLLYIASAWGNLETAKFLINEGAHPNAADPDTGSSPLLVATYRSHTNLVAFLLRNGADADHRSKRGKTALHGAAQRHSLKMAKLLVGYANNLDQQDEYGETALSYAVREGHLDLSRFLLNHGATPNTKDSEFNTPLHVAAANGYRTLVELLLKNGAKVNARGESGRTPLHLAFIGEDPDIAKQLIDAGARVNAKDRYGNTPLHLAARYRETGVAAVLVESGADVNAWNWFGITPTWEAINALGDNKQIVAFLQENGGTGYSFAYRSYIGFLVAACIAGVTWLYRRHVLKLRKQ